MGLSAGDLDHQFRAEVADVLGQVLLLARDQGVDLEVEIDKWLRWHPQR
jgi:NTP pyrophosphatase (non-canonical NTP hydrolase)